jgi:hypothetical protein
MRPGLLLVILVLPLLAASSASGAASSARPIVGVGEQSHLVHQDHRIAQLGIRHFRFVIGWDAMRSRWQREEMDAWLGEARRTGADVVVSFNVSRTQKRRTAPSPRVYRTQFRRFHKRFPWVRSFIPWNEANHRSQPTSSRPRLAAAYYDVIRDECPRCTVVAADVLDWGDFAGWLRAFKRHTRHKPRLWGLHNYVDANRFRTSGTRTMLRAVRGKIWFTETGGIVSRGPATQIVFPSSVKRAKRATRWVFKLARMSPRVKRVYFYHWMPASNRAHRWDSALVNRRGKARPALKVIARWLRVKLRKRPAVPPFRPSPSPPPQQQPVPPPQPAPPTPQPQPTPEPTPTPTPTPTPDPTPTPPPDVPDLLAVLAALSSR